MNIEQVVIFSERLIQTMGSYEDHLDAIGSVFYDLHKAGGLASLGHTSLEDLLSEKDQKPIDEYRLSHYEDRWNIVTLEIQLDLPHRELPESTLRQLLMLPPCIRLNFWAFLLEKYDGYPPSDQIESGFNEYIEYTKTLPEFN